MMGDLAVAPTRRDGPPTANPLDEPQASRTLRPSATRTIRIAFVSDPHCYRIAVGPWSLLGKRALGWANLVWNRRNHFDAACFARCVHRAQDIEADLLLVGGDLTQTSLGSEFRIARRILSQFAGPKVVIPGNHDRYTYAAQFTRRFERWLRDVGAVDEFPAWFDLDNDLRLIALDPTRPSVNARGTLPGLQLRRFQALLDQAKDQGVVPLVACHYPAVVPPGIHHKRSHRMTNEDAVRQALVDHQAPLVFANGHIHRMWVYQPAEGPHVLSLNPGACGSFSHEAPLGNGFLELVFEAEAGGTRSLTVRAHRQALTGRWLTHDLAYVPDLMLLGRDSSALRHVTLPRQPGGPDSDQAGAEGDDDPAAEGLDDTAAEGGSTELRKNETAQQDESPSLRARL